MDLSGDTLFFEGKSFNEIKLKYYMSHNLTAIFINLKQYKKYLIHAEISFRGELYLNKTTLFCC